MKKNPDQNSKPIDPNGHLNFLEDLKKANPEAHEQWTPAEVREKFKLEEWDPEDVKLSNKFYSGIVTVRRKALAEARRLLLFVDGYYQLARKRGLDAMPVKKMVLRLLAMRDRHEKRIADILDGAAIEGWLGAEAIRILRRELIYGGPLRRRKG